MEKAKTAGTVAIIYDGSALAGDAASRDVIEQMAAVEGALAGMGAKTVRLAVDLDLAAFKRRLTGIAPDLVFNLVESLDHSDRLQTMIPLLLEDWRISFTGSGSAAMLLANNKVEAKLRLSAQGLPVPKCCWLNVRDRLHFLPDPYDPSVKGDAIIKTMESHASLFMDDNSVLRSPELPDVLARIREMTSRHNMLFFGEHYIEGREFNISLVETERGIEVLPAAEISFSGLAPSRPRIVGYAAKWEDDSPEYLATPRIFDFPATDAALVAKLRELAIATWKTLGLSGYARVDFRVDTLGRPYILEANANPCLSPDAGLAAAVARAGHDYQWLVEQIADSALCRSPSSLPLAAH